MRYVALLRGINVGGKSLLKMADLRSCLDRNGFRNVTTYIQSGNVVFESDVKDAARLVRDMQKALSAAFAYDSAIVLKSHDQFKTVVAKAPRDWRSGRDLRCYVAFLLPPLTARHALAALEPKEGVDAVKAGDGVLYMSTLLSRVNQSGFTKIVGTDVYQQMTIRTYSTCRKILALMAPH